MSQFESLRQASSTANLHDCSANLPECAPCTIKELVLQAKEVREQQALRDLISTREENAMLSIESLNLVIEDKDKWCGLYSA